MKNLLNIILGLLIGIAVGLIIGALITVIFTDKTFSQFFDQLLSIGSLEGIAVVSVAIMSFLVSILILIPLHEAGHLVFGLLTGYKFVSFRIFNLTLIEIDNKFRVKKFSVAGTGGQCLLTPPKLPLDQIPTSLYNAGGVIANIFILLLVLPMFFYKLNPFVSVGLVIFCFVDAFIIIVNGIPMKLGGVSNDGYNIIYLNRNPLSKQSIVLQLRSNALIQDGTRPKDMPEDWFCWKTDIDYKNPLEVSIPMMHASRLLDEFDFEGAYDEFKQLHSHKNDIMQLYVNEIECELLFCAMVTGDKELSSQLLTPRLKKYIDTYSKVMSSKQRLLCAISFYVDGDREKALEILKTLKSNVDTYLLQGEVKSDIAIMNHILTTNN